MNLYTVPSSTEQYRTYMKTIIKRLCLAHWHFDIGRSTVGGTKKTVGSKKTYPAHMFLGLLDPDPDPIVRGMDLDQEPFIIKQK